MSSTKTAKLNEQRDRDTGDLWCLIAKSYFDSLSKGQSNNKGMWGWIFQLIERCCCCTLKNINQRSTKISNWDSKDRPEYDICARLKFEKYLRLFGYLINYLAIKSPETIRKSICRNFSTAANRLVFNILEKFHFLVHSFLSTLLKIRN